MRTHSEPPPPVELRGSSSPQQMWLAVQVRPQKEQEVAIHLRHKGYEEFVPTSSHQLSSPRRLPFRKAPLFPGYLFCRTNQLIPAGLIVTTPGVIRILGTPGNPWPISDEDIAAIHKIVFSGLRCGAVRYQAHPGEKLRIIAGSLAGLCGTLMRVKNEDRFVVSIELLQRAVAVEIDVTCLAPIGSRIT